MAAEGDERKRWIAVTLWGLAVPALMAATGLRYWIVTSAWTRPALSENPEVGGAISDSWTVLDAMRTSTCAVAFFCCLALATVALARTKRQFLVALTAWQVLLGVVLIVETAGGMFAIETGSPVDLYVVAAGFAPKMHRLIFASVPTVLQLAAVTALGICLVVPWLALWRNPPTIIPTRRAGIWFAMAVVYALMAVVDLSQGVDARAAVIKSPLALIATQTVEVLFEPDVRYGRTTRAPGKVERGADPQNVVVVFLESTRRDIVAPWATRKEITPNLGRLAEDSLVFDRAYAPMPSTSKAVVATLCGIYPDPTVYFTAAAPGRVPQRCLPHLFADAGYEVMFVQSGIGAFQFMDSTVRNVGFTTAYHLEDLDTTGFEPTNYLGYEEGVMLAPTEKWIEEHKEKPFFATIMTLSSHHDYRLPGKYVGKWNDDPERNAYASAVHLIDAFVGEVVEMLKRQGVWDDTVLVVLGDHGEAFGDHYLRQHSAVLYEEATRIPLLVRIPGRPAERVDELFFQMDLLPTVLQASGNRLVGGDYDGLSLDSEPARGRSALFCLLERQCMGVIDWPYKFIYNHGLRKDELYDLEADPHERQNLVDEQGALVEELRRWVASEYVRIREEHGALEVRNPLE